MIDKRGRLSAHMGLILKVGGAHGEKLVNKKTRSFQRVVNGVEQQQKSVR